MIQAIRIQNLRSLKDTGFVELKPVTVLLGGNSSGKSTFLRTFPLLTQSAAKRLRNAIAWFDDASVDFGDIQTARTWGAESEPIVISLKLSNFGGIKDIREANLSLYRLGNVNIYSGATISIALSSYSDNKGAFISYVKIEQAGQDILLNFSEKSEMAIFVNGEKVNNLAFIWQNHSVEQLLPNLKISSLEGSTFVRFYHEIKDLALEPLVKYCGKRFTHKERLRPMYQRWKIDPKRCLDNFKKFNDIATLRNEMKNWNVNSKPFREIYNSLLAMSIWGTWDELNSILARYFLNCDYIAPLRAEATRYYRNQGMQVDRIDAYGRNLAEFIDSMTRDQRASYNEFVERVLNVNVNVRNNIGHQSISLQPISQNGSSGKEVNIADVGFGYSQILPIVTKLWFMQERKRFNRLAYYKAPFATALIEQPELHLHPALQARLADAFMRASINPEAQTSILLETHSPTIINRIGRRIREGCIPTDSVNIVIFDKNYETGLTNVRSTFFNSNGQIEEWPYGFFEPANESF